VNDDRHRCRRICRSPNDADAEPHALLTSALPAQSAARSRGDAESPDTVARTRWMVRRGGGHFPAPSASAARDPPFVAGGEGDDEGPQRGGGVEDSGDAGAERRRRGCAVRRGVSAARVRPRVQARPQARITRFKDAGHRAPRAGLHADALTRPADGRAGRWPALAMGPARQPGPPAPVPCRLRRQRPPATPPSPGRTGAPGGARRREPPRRAPRGRRPQLPIPPQPAAQGRNTQGEIPRRKRKPGPKDPGRNNHAQRTGKTLPYRQGIPH
jgi:hypothetical protein